MNWPLFALSVGLSFLFLVLVFRPLEMAFPAKAGQRFFRPAWFTDLCFFLGQYCLWGALVFWLLTRFDVWLSGILPAGFRRAVASQPWFLQAVEVVLLSDFFVYWGHRLQHKVGSSGGFIASITAPSIWIGWRRIASIRSTRSTRWA